MRFLFIVVMLFATTSFAQVQITAKYRYFFNSDVNFTDHQIYNPVTPYAPKTETTVASNTNNSLIGANIFIPFNVFDEISPLYSNRFSLDIEAYYQFDHNIGSKPVQQYYRFGLDFKLTKKHPIYLNTTLTTASTFKGFENTAIDGHEYKVGINYNITDQKDDGLVNFYAATNWVVSGDFNTLKPYGNHFVTTHDFETIIGLIINIKDFFYFEQGIRTYTEFNYPESFSFSPYYSDYTTRAAIVIGDIEINYIHICFHPIVSDNSNPYIGGQLNSFGVSYEF